MWLDHINAMLVLFDPSRSPVGGSGGLDRIEAGSRAIVEADVPALRILENTVPHCSSPV